MPIHLSPESVKTKHYLMISALVENLRRNGCTEIEADHLLNTTRPQNLPEGDLIPDVVANKDGRKFYFEVKTEEDLFCAETEEQIRAFSQYALDTGGEFYLLVPSRCITRVKYLLDILELPEVRVLYI